MPELPEVAAIAHHLDSRVAGLPIRRVDVASLAVLKTADPPYTALVGRTVTGVDRIGKYLVVRTVVDRAAGGAPDGAAADDTAADDTAGEIDLVIHLSRAGWVRWRDTLPPTPPRPGGAVAVRVHCGLPDEGFDVTEAGTRKRLAAWVVRHTDEVARIAALGPDALAVSRDDFGEIVAASTARVKNLLIDQRSLAGIGNAYSDEILHTARCSPFATGATLPPGRVDDLYEAMRTVLREATDRLDGSEVARLKSEKRTGLRVHGRTGLPCPVCGDTVREVSFSDRSFQYCPTCQTDGRVLADRRMSRLLR